ncbi:MAG: hypothetical protein Q4E83_01315 [bacterium]|nr:hypothetical protein [bacterium]
MKKNIYKINGKKGGRPKSNAKNHIKIPNINLVILTSTQYDTLCQKYGDELLKKAISILENWLSHKTKISEKYIGKNNYAHFRSDGWVINTAKSLN